MPPSSSSSEAQDPPERELTVEDVDAREDEEDAEVAEEVEGCVKFLFVELKVSSRASIR